MRCNSRPATSSSCSPTLTLIHSAGGGLGRARGKSRRGLLFSFFYPNSAVFSPDPLAHIVAAILVQTPIPPQQGASRGQYVIYLGNCPARAWLSHPTQPDVSPHLKPERRYPPATGLPGPAVFLCCPAKWVLYGSSGAYLVLPPPAFFAAGYCTNHCTRRRDRRLPAACMRCCSTTANCSNMIIQA